jgi:hypothetical protein
VTQNASVTLNVYAEGQAALLLAGVRAHNCAYCAFFTFRFAACICRAEAIAFTSVVLL